MPSVYQCWCMAYMLAHTPSVVVLGPTMGGEGQEVRSRRNLCVGRIVEVPNGVVTLACREQHIT